MRRIAGGKASDYAQHILIALNSIAAIYSRFYQRNPASDLLQRIYKAFICTLTDRAPVNTATVNLLAKELNCQLELRITSKCWGKEGTAANLILGVSKLRYKASSGDPEGFKSHLCKNGLPLSTVLRYVGNRLHVLMHLAGVILCHMDNFQSYLNTTCSAQQLRSAVLADLENKQIMDQVGSCCSWKVCRDRG